MYSCSFQVLEPFYTIWECTVGVGHILKLYRVCHHLLRRRSWALTLYAFFRTVVYFESPHSVTFLPFLVVAVLLNSADHSVAVFKRN